MSSSVFIILFVFCGRIAVSQCKEPISPPVITDEPDGSCYSSANIPPRKQCPKTTGMNCPQTSTCPSGSSCSGTCMNYSCLNETDVVIRAFLDYDVVPQIIPHPPTRILKIKTEPNQEVIPGDFVLAFSFGFPPYAASWEADSSSLHTLIFLNADVNNILYGSFESVNLSYLIVNIPGNNAMKGDILQNYRPYLPIPGYGPQRYVGLIYKQSARINVTLNLTMSVSTTDKFYLSLFVKDKKLGNPIFGNVVVTWLLFGDSKQNRSCGC